MDYEVSFLKMRTRVLAFLLLAATAACAPPRATSVASAPSSEVAPDHVADSLLTDVGRLEPGVRVNLRYLTSDNFTGAPLPGYQANRALLRREAAAAFAAAHRSLAAAGLGLEIYDAYRPVRATIAMMEWTRRVGRTDLVRDGYIAERSRHNLGLAVDCTIVDAATGRELDMGTPFDTFSAEAHTANATEAVERNRQLLKSTMERAGFSAYEKEWWHFSYQVPDPLRFDKPIR